MDFSLSEAQKMLRASARDFLKNECPSTLVKEMAEDEKGYSSQLWQKMAQLGWQGLALPEQFNGSGGNFLDLVVLLEETGRFLLPGPLTTTVLGGIIILECGNDQQKAAFLPAIANGDIIISLALNEPSMRNPGRAMSTRAIKQNKGFILNGVKLFVPMANAADKLICFAGTDKTGENNDGITCFILDSKSPGITFTPLKTLGRDKQYELVLDNVEIRFDNILGEPDRGWQDVYTRLMPKVILAQCAEMIGGAQRVFEMTVNYAKERITFGRPLGSNQVIQHLCADMLLALESARVITYEAAWKICQGLPCELEVSIAKYKANECFSKAVSTGTQIQGGISIIIDHELPLYYRRAKANELTFGGSDYHLEQIASKLLD